MRILISGAAGLIGSALTRHWQASGHHVVPLLRREIRSGEDALSWNLFRNDAELRPLHGFDAVIHLAGENLASGRWTSARKQEFRTSRVHRTRLLSEALARVETPPRAFIAASAVGYYGDRGAEELTEDSAAGTGFVSDLVRDWEAAAAPAAAAGIRVVNLRMGVVLAHQGGALPQLILPFRLGLGGPLAGGRYYFSWISLDDVVRIFDFALNSDVVRGPVNACAPNPLPQRDFARALGRAMHRPSFFNVPLWALRLRTGSELAGMLTASQRVIPQKLIASGFPFADPDISTALLRLFPEPESPSYKSGRS